MKKHNLVLYFLLLISSILTLQSKDLQVEILENPEVHYIQGFRIGPSKIQIMPTYLYLKFTNKSKDILNLENFNIRESINSEIKGYNYFKQPITNTQKIVLLPNEEFVLRITTALKASDVSNIGKNVASYLSYSVLNANSRKIVRDSLEVKIKIGFDETFALQSNNRNYTPLCDNSFNRSNKTVGIKFYNLYSKKFIIDSVKAITNIASQVINNMSLFQFITGDSSKPLIINDIEAAVLRIEFKEKQSSWSIEGKVFGNYEDSSKIEIPFSISENESYSDFYSTNLTHTSETFVTIYEKEDLTFPLAINSCGDIPNWLDSVTIEPNFSKYNAKIVMRDTFNFPVAFSNIFWETGPVLLNLKVPIGTKDSSYINFHFRDAYGNYRLFSQRINIQTANWSSMREDENNSLISIFPNPANDNITIQLESLQRINHLKLIDLLGEEIMNIPSPQVDSNGELQMYLSNLSNGNYYILVDGEFGKIIKRLIISK